MSLESLSYAEAWHFYHNIDYRQALKECLKNMGIPLRMPAVESQSTIDGFMMTMNRVRGIAPTKVRKRWDRKKQQKYEEQYG